MDQELISPEPSFPSLIEHQTAQFYRWEKRGRGWQVWDYPVELEPPFRSFMGHYAPSLPAIDDARRPTLFSALIGRIKGYLNGPSSEEVSSVAISSEEWEELDPAPSDSHLDLVELSIALPPKLKIDKQRSEQFLLGLSYCTHPVSFEVIGSEESICVQIVCREPDRPQLLQQVRAYFPEATITEGAGYLKECWDAIDPKDTVIVEFGLSQEFMRPLRSFRNFEVDPLIGITAALEGLGRREVGILQILFQATRHPWAENIMRSVTDWRGGSFFADAPEMIPFAKEKVSFPLFAAVLRVAARCGSQGEAWHIVRGLGGALSQFANPRSNELIPLSNDAYTDSDHEDDLLKRQTHRGGMLLNSEELTSMAHLPSASVRSERLKREEKKTRAAPTLADGHKLTLGENRHQGTVKLVTLNPEQRMRHTYVIGTSGTGKSTLLLNMIIQDIQNGEGVGVLDPHGDLIDQILGYIPEERSSDVVLFDPSDEEFPVGFNILSAHSELEKNLLSSDLVAVFRRLSTSWGDQMTSVLGNAILAFLESEQGGTLADLRRFLIEADFRRGFLKAVRDPEVVYYWEKEYPLITGKPQGPLLTRLDTFLRPKLIRYMVSQKENRVDFGTIMNQGKIFLAKLAQGAIGEENAYLLGTLLVSKIHQIAMSRQEIRESERRNFWLYIDEFQNFITPSMAAILSGARKYHLGLILAHQELRQLWNRDTDVASAVISNPYTRICFRLGDFDAKKLEDGFSHFDAKDLQSLGIGEAICRIEQAEYDFNLKTAPLGSADPALAKERQERLISLSREKYATKRKEVEAQTGWAWSEVSPLPQVAEEGPKKEKRETVIIRPVAERAGREAKKWEGPIPSEPAPLGRGGQQHRYLQQLVKRLAQDKGYHAIIEKPILDGVGSVDVSLEKDEKKIACEISVTSTGEQELGNIQKCLAADYDQVILLSSEKKTLNKIREVASDKLEQGSLERVLFLLPEEFITHLEQTEAQAAGKEHMVRGYKVKVKYQTVGEAEKKTRRQAVAQVIFKALKRLKGGKP